MEELMEYICDEICQFPQWSLTQEDMDRHCEQCKVMEILKEAVNESSNRKTREG